MDEKEQRLTVKDYLDLIYDEPYKIGEWLGFGTFNQIHNEWLKMMIFSDKDETLLAHRGSFKTTCLSIAIPTIMVLFPNKNIIFLRKTDTDVKEVTAQVSKILKSSLFCKFVNEIYDTELKLVEDSTFNITTNLMCNNKGASQLLSQGINTSITGKHADIVITDDIVNIQDRISKPKRDLTKTSYMELQNIKNRDGRILNTGTPWHKDDAIATLMPNVQKFDCYSTGLIDRKKLEELRQTMTPSLFSANYELKHIAAEDCLFENPEFIDDVKLIYNGIAHIDASYGGADGTAFTGCKKQPDGTFVMIGKRWDKHVDDCLNEIYELIDTYQLGTIHCEKNADKGYLAKQIRNDGRPVRPYDESANKYIKISTWLRKYWKKIRWLEETDPDYINEILDYNENAEHDDSPDSASSLIRQIEGKGKWLV